MHVGLYSVFSFTVLIYISPFGETGNISQKKSIHIFSKQLQFAVRVFLLFPTFVPIKRDKMYISPTLQNQTKSTFFVETYHFIKHLATEK